jgi:hypothetical protein
MAITPVFAVGHTANGVTTTSKAVVITGDDRLLQVTLWCSNIPTSVLCDGVAMTLMMSHASISTIRVYYLKAPNLGAVNVTINFAVSSQVVANILLDTGILQAGGPNVMNNVGLVGSVNVSSSSVTPSVDGCMVYGNCILNTSAANNPDAGANTTRRVQTSLAAGIDNGTFTALAPTSPAALTTLNFTSTALYNHYTMSWAWAPAPEPPSSGDDINKYLMTMKMQ